MKREAEDPRNMTEGEPRGSAAPGRSESAEKATDKGSGSSVVTAAASSRAAIGASMPSPLVLKVHLTFLKQFLSSFPSRGWGS